MTAQRPTPSGLDSHDSDALVLEGRKAKQSGRLSEASALFERALRARPDHSDALYLAGACAFAQGDVAATIRLLSKAIRVLPSHLGAYINLSTALELAGRFKEAIDACRKALLLKPDSVEAYSRLAQLLAGSGPYDQALAHARVALALAPDCVEALCAKGMALRRLQKFVEADAAYARAVEVAPKDLRALTGRAALLATIDRTVEGAELYRRAAALAPKDASILSSLGQAIERGGDPPGAVEVYDRALALDPGSVDVLFWRASALSNMGDVDGAEAGFRQALTTDPNHAPTIYALTRMKRYDFNVARGKQLARLIADPARPGDHRVRAGFALGDLLDRSGDPDAAFKCYAEANRLQAKLHAEASLKFDPEELRNLIAIVEDHLALDYARDTVGWGAPTELPVFVVGMTRSGTTLVEQICASHSQVVGAGELGALLNAAREIAAHNEGRQRIADWDPVFARAQADRHAEDLVRLAKGARRVVDKSPQNVTRLGLIGALFPNARVIWCHRDPRDVVVSNHTLYLGANPYSTDLRHCACAVRQMERIGASWVQHLKLPVLNVTYEDLVADLDGHVRRIIDFLGLDWEPACLDFHKTGRRVNTPSNWQVRQPLYASSIGRWRRYEKHLGPMFEAFAQPL